VIRGPQEVENITGEIEEHESMPEASPASRQSGTKTVRVRRIHLPVVRRPEKACGDCGELDLLQRGSGYKSVYVSMNGDENSFVNTIIFIP
jgi:hypothetical protein